MTEINIDVFGTTYELGLDPVPPTTLMWSPESFLRKGVSAAPIVSGSAAAAAIQGAMLTNNATSPVHSGAAPGFSTAFDTTPAFYVIPTPDHPRQPVFVYKQNPADSNGAGAYYPSAWHSGQTFPGGTAYPADQQTYCLNVPVPLSGDGATAFEKAYGKVLPDGSSDHHVTIYDPWHDELWDFQQFATNNTGVNAPLQPSTVSVPPQGWTAPADGYYYRCTQPGYIGPLLGTSVRNGDGIMRGSPTSNALPDGSTPTVSASGLCLMAGTISLDDQMRGAIPHMLEIAIACGSGHLAPAYQDDVTPARTLLSSGGGTNNDFTYQTPEGAIYRIDPTWTLPPVGDLISAHAELAQIGLGTATGQLVTPWHQMIWKAMRDYGFVVADFGSNSLFLAATNALDTPYCNYSTTEWNANRALINPGAGGSPGNPFGTAPWSLVQQVQYPF